MKNQKDFLNEVLALAVPVALQSMLQSSFSIVDQLMIGQLGSVSIAGVGIAGKFTSIVSVMVSAIGAVAGIMVAQYLGQKNGPEVRRSFWLNLGLSAGIAAAFALGSLAAPEQLMGLYTRDAATRQAAVEYLTVVAVGFLPLAGATLLSTLLRCAGKPRLPLYASIFSAVLNTGLNAVLIFGWFGFAPMGARGAAIATVVSQCANFLLMLVLLPCGLLRRAPGESRSTGSFRWRQYLEMLLPILVCEAMWSLGENVYAAIYGHMGTQATAAMTLINPVQGLVTGALCGLSQAAGILVGKKLGEQDDEGAYAAGGRLVLYGAVGAVVLSVVVVLTRAAYVQLYQVEPQVRQLTCQILLAYALVAPFKVVNMILGGGVLRSGGNTRAVMLIDMMGTWVFGVPMGLLAAFVWKLSIPWVYFLLSLEEAVRVGVSLLVFRRRGWMRRLEGEQMTE